MPTSTPIYRDFLAYQRLTIDHASTRQVAAELDISQTRVRQIVRRVTDWLAENAPPASEADDAKRLRLAQQIAADRLEHYLQEANAAWHKTREVKYLSLLARLVLAQSKIPAVPGTLEAIITDAILAPAADDLPNNLGESNPHSDNAEEYSGLEPSDQAHSPPPPLALSPTPNSPTAHPPRRTPNTAPLQSTIQNRKSQTAPPHPIPPPSFADRPPSPRDCSLAPVPSPPDVCHLSPPAVVKLSAQERSEDSLTAQHVARRAFFAPAHPSSAGSEASPITELKMTPQKLTIHSGHRPNRRERRRLQRMAAKT